MCKGPLGGINRTPDDVESVLCYKHLLKFIYASQFVCKTFIQDSTSKEKLIINHLDI